MKGRRIWNSKSQIQNSRNAACKLFRLIFRLEAENDWLGIEMRCAACAAVKVQNFSSRATVATNHLVRLKSAAHNRPDSTAIPCGAAKRWPAMASNFAKSRRSNGSISSWKDNLGITSNELLA